MADSSASATVEQLLQVLKEEPQNRPTVASEHRDEWMSKSLVFRQINDGISSLIVPKNETVAQPSAEPEASATPREIKLYSATQFRSHINRVYPFHLDYFSEKLSSLDFEQHRMGLYLFYDVNRGCLINELEKESSKKTNRGKNMKRMNGLLLNEHRMFNECAKDYATKHLARDYQAMKPAVDQFMKAWLQRKTDVLLKRTNPLERLFSHRMSIPLNSYDSVTPITFVNLSTVLRLGTIPLLTVPDRIDQTNVKCSDNHDRVVANRFNPQYRLTNLADDPNLLAILSQHPSVDIIASKSSFHLLIELFSAAATPMTLPVAIREFQFEAVDNPAPVRKKVIVIDKALRRRAYTKRELNGKFFQRSFRSLLLSTTGGKRETTDNQFYHTSFNNKTEFQITEIKNRAAEKAMANQPPPEEKKVIEDDEDDDDDDDEDKAMIISTDGDVEQQQKLFNKSKQKIIHSAPVLQERDADQSDNPESNAEVPVVTRVKLATPGQSNYEYCLWQLGTLQILIRSSYHGYCRDTGANVNEELVTCYAKLEYQPQFGLEQITDREYRRIWYESYLRQGASVLIGRINVFTQQLLKVEKMSYDNIDQNLKECQIDMLKPLTKVYGLLYGLQSLEPKNYLLTCALNEDKLQLYQTGSNESDQEQYDLHSAPFESNELLVESDHTTVPWVPLTPTLLLPYHLEFERVPLTFCPRHKRCYDIEITVPAYRKRRNTIQREEKSNEDKKKRKKQKKKNAQRRKKKGTEQTTA